MLEILPIEAPLTLFVWSKQRIVPVRVTDLSVTEEAFDTALNPIRAKVSIGMRVLSVDDLGFDHRGGTLFMGYLRNKEALAGARRFGRAVRTRGGGALMPDPLQALLSGNALPSTNFPPDSRYAGIGVAAYVRAAGAGDEPVTIAYLRRRLVPSAGALRDAVHLRHRRGRPARPRRGDATRRPGPVVAARRRQRRHRPAPT